MIRVLRAIERNLRGRECDILVRLIKLILSSFLTLVPHNINIRQKKKMMATHLIIIGCLIVLTGKCSEGLQSPPTMIKQPPPDEKLFEVFQSSDAEQAERPFVLECEAKGNPEPTYTWKKNGMDFSYVAYDKRITQQPRRGSLVFTKPQAIDEGLYQCFAENKHGRSVSNAVFLKKAELNSFSNGEVLDVYAEEGQPLTIPCNPPTGYPKPQVFWIIQSKSGALINGINSSRLSVDPEGNLHFSNVTQKDMLPDALYACSATSTFKTTYRVGRRTNLRVESSGTTGQTSYSPVKQYTSPPQIPTIRGKSLELFCIYGGTPLPEVSWVKRNGKIRDGVRRTNFGKTLRFPKVEFGDEGKFAQSHFTPPEQPNIDFCCLF